MTTQEIGSMLKHNEAVLLKMYKDGAKDFWDIQPENKWKAGQHLIHLVQSTKPLVKAFSYPSLILRWKFGTSNREARTYNEVVNRYHEKLKQVGNVVSPYSASMPDLSFDEFGKWANDFSTLNDNLVKKILKLKDEKLDKLLLPHPLMGKMTLREILMWNAYHTKHHCDVLLEKYHF